MKGMQKPMKSILSAAILSAMATGAHAAGFSLYTESSAAATGNFAAGIAAEGYDASIGWYNPAGLVLIRDQQAVFGGVGVFPGAKLSGNTAFATVIAPGLTSTYRQSFSDIKGEVDAFVPSFHYALPLGENATFGVSVTSPYGLATDWSTFYPTRYAATFTELITTNISPQIGGRITEHFALGAGVDLQYARVKFNSIIGAPAFLQFIGANPMLFDSYSYNKGDSFGTGFHVGALAMFNDNNTRIGLNYQSVMHHEFHGYSTLTGRLASGPALDNHNASFTSDILFSNPIELPDVVTLSGFHHLNDKVDLLASVVYTGWHTVRNIQLNNVAAFSLALERQVLVNSTSTENYDNAWRFAVGANYHVNDVFMIRVGGGYDETPTQDAFRTIRLPDADRWALSVGAHYQWRPNLGVDVGYTHLFADDVLINKTVTAGPGSTFNVNATGKARADLLGAQLVWMIDQPAPVPAGK
ncbi:OmpP1/FadL family transporter [Legionella sp. MW5194]|uniref:OmpP1/FadL family transporter n=1 Tax=Legionella sp. MW5194 TaxID=2662448 RepID=UPI00193E74AB|nr:outer membrane protein transport protein [Legionella sp. MW5194]